MKILKLSPYFFPEQISSTHLTDDLHEAFEKNGFKVEVYTPIPTRGVSKEVRKKYSKIKCEKLYNGSVIVNRFNMFQEVKNPFLRAIRYILVNIIQYFKGCKAKNIEIIYAASTPPTQGLLCALVKKRLEKKYKCHIPLLFSLQDVFPDSMVQAGMIKTGSFLWKIGSLIEKYTYKNVDKIIVISEDIKINILKKGVPEHKIEVIRNWIDTKKICPIPNEKNILRKELKLKDNIFYIVYAGNLGKAQGIDTILDAAIKLKNHLDIQFLIFGNGVEEKKIKKRINEENISNVNIYPLQPVSRVAEVYSLGDVCIVSCKKGYGQNAFPSKTASIMATGTPIIASFDNDSELCKVIESNNLGICSEPDNPIDLSKKIYYFKENIDKIIETGKNAREFAEENFSKEKCVKKYILLLKELCN